MNWKIKQVVLFLFVFMPVHAALHVLKNDLDQLADDLSVLEEILSNEAKKNREIAEIQRKNLEEQERLDREKRFREEQQRRLAQEQRERDAQVKRQEKLMLEQERERQVAERLRLKEQERIDREKREFQEEQRRLAQEQRERDAQVKRQEELRLEQERRLAQEKRDREIASKRRVDLILQKERVRQAAERKRLEKQNELSFSRITTVPYDVDGNWAGKFVGEIDSSGKLSVLDYHGYIFFGSSSLFKGWRHRPEDQSEPILENYYKPKTYYYSQLPKEVKRPRKEQLKQVKKDLVGLYKIHLMPQNANDFMIILEKFIKALEANPQLQTAVNTLKVKSNFDFEHDPELLREKLIKQWGQNEVPPIIVIATSLGKENAQLVLDTVYNLFKDIKGLNLTPRFNEKITDLIYYAQGNSNDKLARPEYFTEDTILYKPDFVSKKNPEDYHLNNPATK